MYILAGSSANRVAVALSKEMGCRLAKTTFRRFPDNEIYVRILDRIEGEEVIIVQNTYPDTGIVELLLIEDAVYEANANKTIVVIPYFGYSRQDKKFEEGEPISARAVAEHIGLHADYIVTVDPHKEHVLDFFNVNAESCTAVPEIAKYLKNKNIDLVLAPDKGAVERAQRASEIIGCECDYLEKTRVDAATVEIKPKNLEISGKKVVVIDDIISTGGTMARSIKELKRQGAEEVLVACTHGLFVNEAKKKLLSAGCDEIISTDTVENEFSKVGCAPCIAEVLLKNL
jgi:ribose-phosphate pyrophosphokinase